MAVKQTKEESLKDGVSPHEIKKGGSYNPPFDLYLYHSLVI